MTQVCPVTMMMFVSSLSPVTIVDLFYLGQCWSLSALFTCDYVDLCHLLLCWSLWPVTMLIFVSSFYLWLCWYLSALLLGAMTGRVKCGTQPRGRSCTPWRGTAMWCTPLHSTIHMGKTFKTSQGNFCYKNTQGSIFTFETYMRWIHTISGSCQRDFNVDVTNEDVEYVKSENYKWRCWKC